MKHAFNAVIAALPLLILVSCSSQPVSSPPLSVNENLATSSTPAPSQTHLWGYWTVSIDPATGQADAVPERDTMFTANVVNFLNTGTGNIGLKINGVLPSGSYTDIDIDVTLKHPFAGQPKYNGYDVRGIFMGNGSGVMAYNSDLKYAVDGTDQQMLPDPLDGFGGPDGYTRWFNKPEFSTGGMPLFQYTQGKLASPGFNGTATLNPYKYFADNLKSTDDLWDWMTSHASTHGVFSSGSANTRNYYLRFPKSSGVVFGYAVTANWTGPDIHPSNAPETVALSVVDNSTVYYAAPDDKGGDLKLDVSVWNWGAQLSAGVMDEYKIKVESTVLSTPWSANSASMTPIGGDENFSTYQLDIPADNVLGTDGQRYWVIVEEKNFNYNNDFGVTNLAGADPLAAFFRYPLTVGNTPTECPVPKPSAIDPNTHPTTGSVDCHITSSNLVGTTGLQVYLDKAGTIDGTYDIAGTNIHNVNVAAGTLDATFDLTGASPGDYYVVLTNSCGKTGASDAALFTATEYLAGDYYVSNSPDFNGQPEEGTMQHPFHTINAALTAHDLDTTKLDLILVDYGTGHYPELIYETAGNFDLRAYNWHSASGRPDIGGLDVTITGWQNYGTLTLGNCVNVTIQGFKLLFVSNNNGTTYHDIYNQYGGNNVTIKDCWFTGDTPNGSSYCAAITIYYVNGTYIENNLFKGINMVHPIADMSGVRIYAIDFQVQTNITIVRNEFTQFQVNGPSDGTDISLHTGYEGGTHGNYEIDNNLYHHIWPTTTDAHSLSYVGENYWDYYDQYYDPDWPFEIAHNTFDNINGNVAASSDATGIVGYMSSDPHFETHSNILSNFANGYSTGISDTDLPDYNDLWQGPQWGGSQGLGNISADPKYVNNTSEPYDYHLAAGSPCIGTGQDGTDMGCYGNLAPGDKIGLLTPEN